MASHSMKVLQEALKTAEEDYKKVAEETKEDIAKGVSAKRKLDQAAIIVSDFRRNLRRIEDMEGVSARQEEA